MTRRIRPKCGVQGCYEPHEALGLCKRHWYRMKRYGSTADRVPGTPYRRRRTAAGADEVKRDYAS